MKVVMNRLRKSPASSCRPIVRVPGRKARRPRVVEALEARTMLDASITISAANILAFAGDPGVANNVAVSYADNVYTITDQTDSGTPISIAVENNGPGVTVDGSGTSRVTVTNLSSLATAALNLNLGPEGNAIEIQSINDPTAVDSMDGGVDTYRVGNGSDGVQGIAAALTLEDTAGTATMRIDDVADTTARTVTLSDTAIVGLAPAPIDFTPGTTPDGATPAAFSIIGGSGGNAYSVINTNPDLSEQLFTDSTAPRSDSVTVTGTAAGGAIAIAAGGVAGSVTDVTVRNVAPIGSSIQGQVLVNPDGGTGSVQLVVDDSAGTSDVTASLSAISDDSGPLGQLTGYTALPLVFARDGSVAGLAIKSGSGNDALTIDFGGGGGNPVPSSLDFDGGSGSNTLGLEGKLTSGTFFDSRYTASEPGVGAVVLFDTNPGMTSILFNGLSLVKDTTPSDEFEVAPAPGSSFSHLVNFVDGPIVPGGASGGSNGADVQTAMISDGSGDTPPDFVPIQFANQATVSVNDFPSLSLNNRTAATGLASLRLAVGFHSVAGGRLVVTAAPDGVATSIVQAGTISIVAGGLGAPPASFSAANEPSGGVLSFDLQGSNSGPINITPDTVTVAGQTLSYANEVAIILNNVQDQILTTAPRSLTATTGTTLSNAVVASFTNVDPYAISQHFAITIDWGDGVTSSGTAVPDASGDGYDVLGSHTYSAAGSFPINVQIATTNLGGITRVGAVNVESLNFTNTTSASIVSSASVTGGGTPTHNAAPISKINVSPIGEFQVFSQGLSDGRFFPGDASVGDAGILIRLPDGTVDGFNLDRETGAQDTHAIAFHPISQTVSPDGNTFTTVFDNSTDNNSLGIRYQVTQVVSYDGVSPDFKVSYQITDEGSHPLSLDVFEAADFDFPNGEYGDGYYDPQTGAVGGVDATGQFRIFFQPDRSSGAQPTDFQEAAADDIWRRIGGEDYPDFNNSTFGPTPPYGVAPYYLNAAAGLEWKSLAVAPGTPTTLSTFVAFGDLSSVGSLTVTNTNDSGPGSLRQAILAANADTGNSATDVISFDIPGGGAHVIRLTSSLPRITHPVVIDGTSQPGYAGTPLIELNGASAGASSDGLDVDAGNSLIRGLAIDRFGGSGIVLDQAGGDVVTGDYIGTDSTGAVAPGNGLDGIEVTGAGQNLIGISGQGNLIAGNAVGVALLGGTTGNLIAANRIGVAASGGTAALANQVGVVVADSGGNLIGGPTLDFANIIGGNALSGVLIFNSGTGHAASGNVVVSDVIWLNGQDGVEILNASHNAVGISTNPAGSPGASSPLTTGGNLIVGNGLNGVEINAAGGNVVQNNLIVASRHDGIDVVGSSGNVIGTGLAGGGNSVDGSGSSGVRLDGAGATGNQVRGDAITNSARYGVEIDDGTANTIGGAGSAANRIQGSGRAGIQFLVRGVPAARNVRGGNTFAGSTPDSVEGPTSSGTVGRRVVPVSGVASQGVLQAQSLGETPHPAGPASFRSKSVNRTSTTA